MKVLILLMAVLIGGCSNVFPDPNRDMNLLKRPIVITAISADGDVVVTGADGKIVTLNRTYYSAKALKTLSVGSVISK